MSVKKYNGFEKCIEGFVYIFLKYQVQKLNSNKIFPFFVIKIKFYPLCTKLYYRKCVFIFLPFHCNAFASLNCALTEIRLILQKQFFTKPNQTLIVTEVLSVFATFHKMNQDKRSILINQYKKYFRLTFFDVACSQSELRGIILLYYNLPRLGTDGLFLLTTMDDYRIRPCLLNHNKVGTVGTIQYFSSIYYNSTKKYKNKNFDKGFS